jgi:hypothetical protein
LLVLKNKDIRNAKKAYSSIVSFIQSALGNDTRNTNIFFKANKQKNHNGLLDTLNNVSNKNLDAKILFSGCDANLVSLQGKLLEVEEVYLLNQTSIDYISLN